MLLFLRLKGLSLAKELYPEHGGSEKGFKELHTAYEMAMNDQEERGRTGGSILPPPPSASSNVATAYPVLPGKPATQLPGPPLCDRRVLRNEGGQRHDAAVLGLIGRTAKELPIAILIVRDEQDRVRSIQDSCGSEDRTVFALVEGPRPVSGKDRLAALERSGKIGMPRIPALPIGPYALQDREVITLVEPPCITKVFPIEVRLDLPKDAQVPFENLVTLTPSLSNLTSSISSPIPLMIWNIMETAFSPKMMISGCFSVW